MIVVARRLSDIALNDATREDMDSFGRSAFNRYYYAAFLITREMLYKINSSWAKVGHSNIPDLLRVTITKQIGTAARKQQKDGLISPSKASLWRADGRYAAAQLADLLNVAYDVRCVADYEPDKRILRDGNVITLIDHTNTEADNWPRRAQRHASDLLRIYEKLGLC